jgi:hypothetical protein
MSVWPSAWQPGSVLELTTFDLRLAPDPGGSPQSLGQTANRGVFIPIRVPRPFEVTALFWGNGLTVAGNIDAGIYAVAGGGSGLLTRVVSTGSVAQSGTNSQQSVTLATPVRLGAGLWVLAIVPSSSSATLMAASPGNTPGIHAIMRVANSVFPLPATVNPTIDPSLNTSYSLIGMRGVAG